LEIKSKKAITAKLITLEINIRKGISDKQITLEIKAKVNSTAIVTIKVSIINMINLSGQPIAHKIGDIPASEAHLISSNKLITRVIEKAKSEAGQPGKSKANNKVVRQ
jgi:hypothetical protein